VLLEGDGGEPGTHLPTGRSVTWITIGDRTPDFPSLQTPAALDFSLFDFVVVLCVFFTLLSRFPGAVVTSPPSAREEVSAGYRGLVAAAAA